MLDVTLAISHTDPRPDDPSSSGTWTALLSSGPHRKFLHGRLPHVASTERLLTAATAGFEALKQPSTVGVITLSQALGEVFASPSSSSSSPPHPAFAPDAALWERFRQATQPHHSHWVHPMTPSDRELLNQATRYVHPAGQDVDQTSQWLTERLDDPTFRALLVEYLHTHPDVLREMERSS